MPEIFPVLLCGGSGTRLWPVSRKSFPKQFVPLAGQGTLFQAAAGRMQGAADVACPLVITNSDFRFIVAEQLAADGIPPSAILIEPSARNTGPAILAAALHLAAKDPEAMLLVMPTDHSIPDIEAFRAAVAVGVPRAAAGQIVTFGILPDRPETGYGWIAVEGAPVDGQAQKVERFVEKPAADRAEAMLAEGRYLWNAGIFLAQARVLIAAFRAHAADLVAPVEAAVAGARADLGFLRLAEVFPRDHRPWGWFETLALADRFQVKRIVVKPGAALSLQSHIHRAEHWIVVSGTAQVTVGDEVKLLSENQSVYVPLGASHRLANPGKVPVVLIEVQTGAYLGEDDIIRYEDIYARGDEKGPKR